MAAVRDAPEGYVVTVGEETRSLAQNAKMHAIFEDVAKSGFQWDGKARTTAQWKVLFISAHAVATNEGAEVIVGLEGELVNVRESSAKMTKSRGASLISYALAFCHLNGIRLREPESEFNA